MSHCLSVYVSWFSEKRRILTDLTIWKLESVHFTFIKPLYNWMSFAEGNQLQFNYSTDFLSCPLQFNLLSASLDWPWKACVHHSNWPHEMASMFNHSKYFNTCTFFNHFTNFISVKGSSCFPCQGKQAKPNLRCSTDSWYLNQKRHSFHRKHLFSNRRDPIGRRVSQAKSPPTN